MTKDEQFSRACSLLAEVLGGDQFWENDTQMSKALDALGDAIAKEWWRGYEAGWHDAKGTR